MEPSPSSVRLPTTSTAIPAPGRAVTPERAPEKAKAETVGKEEERPFYGLPDDPGVKEGAVAKRDGTGSFRLF